MSKEWRYIHNHPNDLIIGDPSQRVRTRALFRDIFDYLVFVSQIEPKSIEEAENGSNWMIAIQKKLNQFDRNNIWILVSRPIDHSIIETK